MPPIHPAIVHFPVALITFAVIADLFGYLRNSAPLRAAGFWSLVAGIIGAALAVAAGYYDMSRAALGETHELVDFHMKVGWIMLVLAAGLLLWRWRLYVKPERGVGWAYLVAAFLVLGLTLFQGWYGGEMVYSHGAGVAAAGKGVETAGESQKRLDKLMKMLGAGQERGGEASEEHKDEAGSHSR